MDCSKNTCCRPIALPLSFMTDSYHRGEPLSNKCVCVSTSVPKRKLKNSRGHGCCFPSHANEAMGISWMGMWTHVPVPACAGHGRRCAQLGSTRPLMGVRGRSLGAERITDSPWASLCAAGMSITFPSSFSFQTVCFQPAFLTHQLRQLP